jgi:hypothetical protein
MRWAMSWSIRTTLRFGGWSSMFDEEGGSREGAGWVFVGLRCDQQQLSVCGRSIHLVATSRAFNTTWRAAQTAGRQPRQQLTVPAAAGQTPLILFRDLQEWFPRTIPPSTQD